MSNADVWAVVLVALAAPAATLYPIIFGLTSPWWRSPVGVALMTSKTGLALLIDISLAYQWLGDDYALRDVVRLTVYAFVVVGAWLHLSYLVAEKWRAIRSRRDDS